MKLDAVYGVVFMLHGRNTVSEHRIFITHGDVVLIPQVFEFVEVLYLESQVMVVESERPFFKKQNVLPRQSFY